MKLFENTTEKEAKKMAMNYLLSYDFEKSESITDKWGFYRQVYMENISDIIGTSKKDIKKWDNSYYLNWRNHFSPIEEIAWDSIREMGNLVLYPQFPVFNHFIDFANPYLKIGVELDGKDYHDIEKDTERDFKLQRFGWKIFRISGKEANQTYLTNNELDDKEIVNEEKIRQVQNWILNSCDGILTAIKYWYFSNDEEKENNFKFYINIEENEEVIDIYSLAKLSLERHNLVNLKIKTIANSRL